MSEELCDLFAVYNGLVAKHEIVFDELQVAVLRELGKYTKGAADNKWKFWKKYTAPPKRGVYLYGDVGRGKSLITSLFYDHCGIERKKKIHFNTFMKQIHDLLHKARSGKSKGFDQMLQCINALIGDVGLLYLDEIQVRDICEAVMIHRIFSVLFSRATIVLMTSNYHPRKLYEDGVQRELFVPAIHLIEEKMDVISLSGAKDYRVVKGSKIGNICRFYVGKDADTKLREHFLKMVGLRVVEKAEFTFDSSRKVQIGEQCGDIVWFSFYELCGNKNPLWASDYKKIARSFRTVFIESIPVFDSNSQNEMQRFIVLIDELYEHKSTLFCSMSAEINKLYAGTPAVDIKRAMSRLSEMSSNQW